MKHDAHLVHSTCRDGLQVCFSLCHCVCEVLTITARTKSTTKHDTGSKHTSTPFVRKITLVHKRVPAHGIQKTVPRRKKIVLTNKKSGSSKPIVPRAQKGTNLLDLPCEILNQIFDFAIPSSCQAQVISDSSNKINTIFMPNYYTHAAPPPITKVNRMFRELTLPKFFARNQFSLITGRDELHFEAEMNTMVNWLFQLTDKQTSHMMNLTICRIGYLEITLVFNEQKWDDWRFEHIWQCEDDQPIIEERLDDIAEIMAHVAVGSRASGDTGLRAVHVAKLFHAVMYDSYYHHIFDDERILELEDLVAQTY